MYLTEENIDGLGVRYNRCRGSEVLRALKDRQKADGDKQEFGNKLRPWDEFAEKGQDDETHNGDVDAAHVGGTGTLHFEVDLDAAVRSC